MNQILVSSFPVAKDGIEYLCILSLRCVVELTSYSIVDKPPEGSGRANTRVIPNMEAGKAYLI